MPNRKGRIFETLSLRNIHTYLFNSRNHFRVNALLIYCFQDFLEAPLIEPACNQKELDKKYGDWIGCNVRIFKNLEQKLVALKASSRAGVARFVCKLFIYIILMSLTLVV